jgi:hypothetical protein
MQPKTAYSSRRDQIEYKEALDLAFRDNRIQRNLEKDGWGCVSPEKAYVFQVKGGGFLFELEDVVLEYSCACAERFGIPRRCEIFRKMLARNSELASSFVAETIFYSRRSTATRFVKDVIQIAQQFVVKQEDIISIGDGTRFKDFLSRKCFV